MTHLDRINKMPPTICRFLARTGGNRRQRPKTCAEIARDGNLTEWMVKKISKLDRWDSVTHLIAERFIQGTGVDPASASQHRRFLNRPDGKKKFLEGCHPAQRRLFDRILPKSDVNNGGT